MKLYRITFEFRDGYSHGKWIKRNCTMRSVEECIKMYGLDECEYGILKVEEIG